MTTTSCMIDVLDDGVETPAADDGRRVDRAVDSPAPRVAR